MQEIAIVVNNMRARTVHLRGENSCNCQCHSLCLQLVDGDYISGPVACQAMKHTYSRATQFWEKSLCPGPEGSNYHNLKYLRRLCPNCGFKLIPPCTSELDPSNSTTMSWRRFEKVLAGKTRAREPKSVLYLEYKTSHPRMFLAQAIPKIQQLVWHQHQAKWQDVAYKSSLAKGSSVSHRLHENYSFKGHDEVQSQHWFNFQLTILVHITYTINPDYNISDPFSKRLKVDYFYYISDDHKYNSLFVQKCLINHWNFLKVSGASPAHHIVWSDGCATQLKGSKAWFFVSR